MPTPDYGSDCNEMCESNHPEMYRTYTRWQICESVLSALFCIAFVSGITVATVITGQKWMAFLYLLPTICYLVRSMYD